MTEGEMKIEGGKEVIAKADLGDVGISPPTIGLPQNLTSEDFSSLCWFGPVTWAPSSLQLEISKILGIV